MSTVSQTRPTSRKPFFRQEYLRKTTLKATAVLSLVVLLVGYLFLGNSKDVLAESQRTVPKELSGFKAVVVGDVCNLRQGPSMNSRVVGQVVQGTWIDVLSYQGDWVRIRHGGKEAWIASFLIDVDLGSRAINARITKTDVNVRKGPGTEFPVLFVTQKDAVFPAQAKRGQWVEVSIGGGKTAWIHESLLQLELPVLENSDQPSGDMLVFPSGASVKIWQTPVQGSTVLGRLEPGQSARYITSKGAFVAVEASGGVKGWVYGPDVRISSVKDPALSFGVSESSWSIGKFNTVTVTATDVNFRSGPGTNYPVLTMVNRGDVLRVIQSQDRWIQAVSPKGVVGWVASWLTSGIKDSSPSFSVSIDASQRSRILTVTGPFQSTRIIEDEAGGSLKVSTSTFFNTEGRLDINCFEFESVKVATSDVTVRFKEKPSYVVREQAPGRVVLEFSPTVTSIVGQSREDRDVLTINTLGYAWPDVKRNGSSISFFLPGASYEGQLPTFQGKLIKSVSVKSQDDGLTLSLDTLVDTPYLLKKNANSLEAYFPLPGLAGKVIVIDPGHGGNDPGAIGPTGLQEKVANWEIAIRVRELLRNAGATVYLTRNGLDEDATPPPDWNPAPDEYAGDLAKRAAWSAKADAFISIHNDYHSDRSISGTASYICERTLNASESYRLASLIQKELSASLGTLDRGVRDSNFFVARESTCPSVLVEVMYLSTPREEGMLKNPAMLDKAAYGIYRAILTYFSPATRTTQ